MSESHRQRTLYLTGFMASGKSTVGQLMASRLGRPFVDLDAQIVARAGKDIAEVFAQAGEGAFRTLEHDCLAASAKSDQGAIIATGGGAFIEPRNRDLMRATGAVIALGVGLDEVTERVGDATSRPLFSRPQGEVRALYSSRLSGYRRGHAVVATDRKSPVEVAEAVAAVVDVTEKLSDEELDGTTVVSLVDRSYPVTTEVGSLAKLGEWIRRMLPEVTRVGLVTDSNVDGFHGDAAREALQSAGLELVTVIVPAGEASKVIESVAQAADLLIAGGLDRSSAVVALGGGVVGDLAGFVAATLFRGVPCVQVPTSLLAMVDSSIGGKTGVDTAAGKNLLGAFWQPRAVIVDPAVLATLPPRELRAAYGELLKYGLLDGGSLFEQVRGLAPWVGAPTQPAPASLAEVIARCISFKAEIVGADEHERHGRRALLNLGHTIGHAIEASAGYGVVLHGEAVALGLLAAVRVSQALGAPADDLEDRLAECLAAAGLDRDLDRWLVPEVLGRIGVDKKRVGQGVGFITVGAPGTCEVQRISLAELERILRPSVGV